MIVLVKVTFYLDSYLYKSLAVFLPWADNSLSRYLPHHSTMHWTLILKTEGKEKGKNIQLSIKIKHSERFQLKKKFTV